MIKNKSKERGRGGETAATEDETYMQWTSPLHPSPHWYPNFLAGKYEQG